MSRHVWEGLGIAILLAGASISLASVSHASTSKSTNYQIDESTIGGGGINQSSSTNFRASNATNDLAVGSAASENFQVESGSQTTHDPTLSFNIDAVDINFGNFSAGAPAVTTAKFSVSNYTSYGYVVQIVGTPPTNGDHTIAALDEKTTSEVGIEQFGINLVANTSPSSVGANPKNGETGHGIASPNYGESNKFRFKSGETIAYAPKSSGETIYTMTYLVNVDTLTPGGQYVGNQTLIVTGTY